VTVATKRYHVRIDDESQYGARPAPPADAVNGCDEIPERQSLLVVIGFHDVLILVSEMAITWASASNQCCTSCPWGRP
jgi:hypothetical protein